MYVYKHINGSFIKKLDRVIRTFIQRRDGAIDLPGEYFRSPFVVMWRHFDSEQEADLWIWKEKHNKAVMERDRLLGRG